MIDKLYLDSPSNYLIYLFHIATYNFALPYVVGKRVLDYGCGSGYGTHHLAASCASIVGVDISDEAIEYAKANYKANNLTYRCTERADNAPLPFADAEFDAILSFQVIEHISDIVPYLSEIHRVLKPGGVFICATPDRSTRLLPKQKPWNMWHVNEYSEETFGCALAPFFSTIEMQCMSGSESVLNIEIRRTKKLMWLTLPLTLPFVPEALRIVGLKLLKRLSGNGKKRKQENVEKYSFDEEDLVIGPNLSPSVNLIAVAHKS